MNPSDVTVVIGLSKGYAGLLSACLRTIPPNVRKIISWYGPGEPGRLPPNSRLVRPKRHANNFSRSYVLNVAIRQVETPRVLLGDADLVFPQFFFRILKAGPREVLRFYVGRVTKEATSEVCSGEDWQRLFADYQGQGNRVFRLLYGPHNPCIYPTQPLLDVHGYDERMVGWGREDDDLTDRTRRLGLTDVRVPILIGRLDDSDISDYTDYHRGVSAAANTALLRSSRPIVANPREWGDASS